MKKIRIAVVLALALVALVLAGVAAFPSLLPTHFESDNAVAHREVAACKAATTEAQKEICYQKNVPTLMDAGLSMERTFSVVRLIQQLDPGYQSCHVLAHLVTSKEVARDPSKWKDVVVRSPMGICGSGAVHGAFQERFRLESLGTVSVDEMKGMLAGVCDPRGAWNPTLLDRSSCMHGMGHLFLYVTQADVKKSVALCAAIAKLPDYDFRQTCYEGVFMQLYQPLEPEDEVLVHEVGPLAKNTKKFCSQFTGLVYNTCVKESWPDVPGSSTDPHIMEALCNLSSDRSAELYCASAIIYPVIETLHYDVPKIEEFCRGIVDPDFRNSCWARTASKFVWADWKNVAKAVGICNDAPQEAKQSCWMELVTYAEQGMPQGSVEAKTLCDAIPDEWHDSCYQKTRTVR
ncbi:hypothetical protein K8R03_02825 [Candidatus Kaiserbacteria bacterium]|nr:hypothetical protein [Candidatus Kaiserbacteria bacterium]